MYCTEEAITAGAVGSVLDVQDLYAHLQTVRDTRERRGLRYKLALVLTLIVLAKLSGEDTPNGIADWARYRVWQLALAFGLKRECMPHHSTYRRITLVAPARVVMGEVVTADELEQVVGAFLSYQAEPGRSVVINIDGKTVRGTLDSGATQGTHLLAAYLPEEGLVLMQMEVGTKENEIPVAQRVLQCLDLRGKVVTGDALHTQRQTSAQIVAAGGDYVWIAKDNQPILRQDIEDLFAPQQALPGHGLPPNDFRAAQTVNTGHGRLEIRSIQTSILLNEYADWPHLHQVFKLERQVSYLKSGQSFAETVYGVTSLDPQRAPPVRLLQLIRSHWGIENGLHYRRDKTLREDGTRMTKGYTGHVMAIINNLVIGLALKQGFTFLPTARRFFNANFDAALSTVGL